MPIRSCHFRFGCLFLSLFELHCAGWNCGRERSKLWTQGSSMIGIFAAAELGCSVSHRKMWFGPAWPLAVWVCYSQLFCSIWFKLFLLYSHTLFQSTHTHAHTHIWVYFLTILLSLLIPPSLPSLTSPLFLLSSLSHSLHPISFLLPSFIPLLFIHFIFWFPQHPSSFLLFFPPFPSTFIFFYLLVLHSSFITRPLSPSSIQ